MRSGLDTVRDMSVAYVTRGSSTIDDTHGRERIDSMADTDTKAAPKRLHRATFATDKRNPGQYLVRVVGPTAAAFAGREVPVTRKDGSESMERLTRAVWAGRDDESGDPVALYAFESRPREEAPADDLPF